MVKIYKQRVFLQYIVSSFSIILSLYLSMNNGRNVGTKFTFLLIIFFGITYLITQSKIYIDSNKLSMKIGRITEKTIDINKIQNISLVKVRFMKSPKLVVRFGKYDKYDFFSKENDIENFIRDIQHINPNVSVSLT
jgi:hypothetical protein